MFLLLAAAKRAAPARSPVLRTVDALDRLLPSYVSCIHLYTKYTVRTPSVSYVVLCSAACCCANGLCIVVPDYGWQCFFLVFGAFYFLSLSFFSYTPWQYCRTNSLELHTCTPSDITIIRVAAGGRQPAAAKPPLHIMLFLE